jgi:hypothetical protein
VLAAAERELPNRHLIARNVQNRTMRVADLHKAFSIVNFHYADPSAAAWNYHLGRVLADDETGFKGQACSPYRLEAWRFLMAGGGVFSHLDYSFTAAHPEGDAAIEGESPSFGGPELRRQLGVLKQFFEGLPFADMAPHDEVVNLFGSRLGGGATAQVLADPGRVYAVYLTGGPGAQMGLGVPRSRYRATWVRTTDGATVRAEEVDHQSATLVLRAPLFAEDIALRLDRV